MCEDVSVWHLCFESILYEHGKMWVAVYECVWYECESDYVRCV